jgi:hypothetical protein
MPDLPSPQAEVRALLDLARRDRAAAGAALAALAPDAQAELVCSAPVARRAQVLDLLPQPEEVIPRLPEAELCFTVKAIGLESATWILEHATPEQLVACLDLDAWEGEVPDAGKLGAWLEALGETSDEALLRSLHALDPELLASYLHARVAVTLVPSEREDFEPPIGGKTLDGQFYLVALREGDDLAALLHLLRVLFERDYWSYFRLLQSAIWEPVAETAEWALRWRTGRLQDLGFPTWEEALGIYRHLAADELAALPEKEEALQVEEWRLPVWIPALPEGAESRHLVFRAIARLSPEERRAAFYAFVAAANAVAVADRMELSDAETTPRAIEKVALWTSRGLEHVAAQTGLPVEALLRRLTLERLFAVGVNLDREAARR